MKHSKIQPDQQGQQIRQQQQKQQNKTQHQQKPKSAVRNEENYQEHEHPELRLTR